MRRYEAMFILRPDLPEEEKKAVLSQINDSLTKNSGSVVSSGIWSEKRKLVYSLGRYHEGTYYLVNFALAPELIDKIKNSYKINENILRVLITKTK